MQTFPKRKKKESKTLMNREGGREDRLAILARPLFIPSLPTRVESPSSARLALRPVGFGVQKLVIKHLHPTSEVPYY